MNLKRVIIFIASLYLCSCNSGSDSDNESSKILKIVATTGMIADIVREVSKGSDVEVIQLIGEGVDPHLFKPTRSDIVKLAAADVVFYNGLLLEGKMTDSFIRLADDGRKVFAVTELIEKNYLIEPEGFSGHFDPHLWMDPSAWSKAVEVVRNKLQKIMPAQKELIIKNTNQYLGQILRLDSYSEKALAAIPKNLRILVTAHDAFNYFGKRYGIEVIGIQGLSTESEAGVQDIEKIVDLLVNKKVPAVFIESTVSERNVKALIEGAKARGHEVSVGGSLFSDAMGKPSTYRGTYLGMIDHNVTVIAKALKGSPLEKGFQGKL